MTRPRLGYLGPAGTFSEEAVRSDPEAAGAELVALRTVPDTVMAVHDGTVDRAVVPIENSLEGPVGITLDTLAEEHDVTIVGELVLAVSPCLIAREPTELGAIERVVSHPQPLAQCARFLRDNLPTADVMSAASTAEAVRVVVAEAAPVGGARHAPRGRALRRGGARRRRRGRARQRDPLRLARPRRARARRARDRPRPRWPSGGRATTAPAGSCAASRSSRFAA